MSRSCSGKVLALLFLALALPLGLLMVRLVPLGQVADEPAHVLKADSLLRGEWIGRRAMQAGPDGRVLLREGIDSDRALLAVIISLPQPLDTTPTRINPEALAKSATVPFGQVGFSEVGTIASYFPAFYLPAMSALGLAKGLHLGARAGFLSARLTNLLLTLSMGVASLMLARRGAGLLFATLLLPPSVALMASVNQDGLLISTSALAASLATRITGDLAPWRQPAYLGVALSVGCICLAKPPYLPMIVLLLLPLGTALRRSPMKWLSMRLTTIGTILLLVLLWSWANVHYAAAPIYRAPEEAGPLWSGPRPAIFDGTDMSAQLHVLLAKPWRLIWLPVHSFLTHPAILRQVVDVLGWLNLMLPSWLVGVWSVALILALFGGVIASRPMGWSAEAGLEAAILIAAVLSTILLIYLSQYLSFTPVGWDWISGPQGRYLIPLLPLIALATGSSSSNSASTSRLALAPTVLAGVASLSAVPACVVAFYYIGRN